MVYDIYRILIAMTKQAGDSNLIIHVNIKVWRYKSTGIHILLLPMPSSTSCHTMPYLLLNTHATYNILITIPISQPQPPSHIPIQHATRHTHSHTPTYTHTCKPQPQPILKFRSPYPSSRGRHIRCPYAPPRSPWDRSATCRYCQTA